MDNTLSNYDAPIADLVEGGIPAWIDASLTGSDLAAILHGGCASGAYMPAVTYHLARETMSEHGDDVLEYVEASYGELPEPPKGSSWSGIAVHYLSCAVELWAMDQEEPLALELERLEDERLNDEE